MRASKNALVECYLHIENKTLVRFACPHKHVAMDQQTLSYLLAAKISKPEHHTIAGSIQFCSCHHIFCLHTGICNVVPERKNINLNAAVELHEHKKEYL